VGKGLQFETSRPRKADRVLQGGKTENLVHTVGGEGKNCKKERERTRIFKKKKFFRRYRREVEGCMGNRRKARNLKKKPCALKN